MSLEQWMQNGWLKPHQTSDQEIRNLMEGAIEDLKSAREDSSAGWKFVKAYNAALRLCTVLLNISGYQAARDQKHYRTITSLPLIISDEVKELTDYLDYCRVKRSQVTYESVFTVSMSESEELIDTVKKLHSIVLQWIDSNFPEYSP